MVGETSCLSMYRDTIVSRSKNQWYSCTHRYLLKLIKNVDQVFANLLHRRKLEAESKRKHNSGYCTQFDISVHHMQITG